MNNCTTYSRKFGRLACALFAVATLAACERSTFSSTKKLGDNNILLTSAELSKTFERTGEYDEENGRFVPDSVVCAEPSPDVVKSVQASFGLSASVAANGTGDAAVAASRAIAESAAQLGERLATIQLLRDGLYRACEAYANGTFSEVTYAVLLSRYDDTMVSLLTAELAAGAFGRSGAALSGEAKGTSASEAELKELKSELLSAESSYEQSREEKRDFETSLDRKRSEERELETMLLEAEKSEGSAEAALDTAIADNAPEAQIRSLDRRHEESRKEVDKLNEELKETRKEVTSLTENLKKSEKRVEDRKEEAESKLKASTEAFAKASATASGGITPGQQNPAIAKTLANMQRSFLQNINSDALVVACVTALARDKGDGTGTGASELSALCKGETGLLATMVESQGALLESVKKRSIIDRDKKALAEAVEQIRQINSAVHELGNIPK